MRITKSDITLELDCWVDELSPAQLAAYEKVANEHNAIKTALKSALSSNEGKELFSGQVFQAYSFKGKVLQEFKEATLPKKPPKAADPPLEQARARGRKRASNFVYLESSDEEEDDVPLAKRMAVAAGKRITTALPTSKAQPGLPKKVSPTGKSSPQPIAKGGKPIASSRSTTVKADKNAASGSATPPANFRPSEISSIGGLVIGNDAKDGKDGKDNSKETKLQGKTFPSLVVLAKPWLKVKDMSATRNKLDSKVKLVLMLTPNKFTEWLIQEGLLKSEQRCANHRNNELKLGVYSDATKFPYTGGYVWISECCPMRFVSVFHGSIFEGAPHPPSCILKLIYHWSCQTNIQNVVQWVKVDNVYIKGVYTWLRAVCTLAVHQKCKKLGGPEKYVEVGVISLGTTSQDGQQRQVKVEVLGVLDFTEKTIRLRAVEPVSDADRNYKKRFQTILEPLQRWVNKDSIISIDLTVDKMTLYSMGFKNIVQAAATDSTAKHNNSAVMDYLRRIVPRMFQNTLSLLSRQMIQQFLDELVWREQFGTYALQAFNNITAHIAEQTRMNTNETLTQRLYQVATNPFKDWSILPPNARETPANNTPKRLKKPINDADYAQPERLSMKTIKKEKEKEKELPTIPPGKRRAAVVAAAATALAVADNDYHHSYEKKSSSSSKTAASSSTKNTSGKVAASTSAKHQTSNSKKVLVETKNLKKEKDDDDMKGLEELYYGVRDGTDAYFESFPYRTLTLPTAVATSETASNVPEVKAGLIAPEATAEETTEAKGETKAESIPPEAPTTTTAETILKAELKSGECLDIKEYPKTLDCPVCDTSESFDSNEKLQTHLVSHITIDGKDHQFQCLFCLEKHASETVLSKHNQIMHPTETKTALSASYHCLICQQRFNSLLALQSHLQKIHNLLELPYWCHACGYRSSSHRDVVRHFYDDHKNQNFLQCPFCLDIFRFSFKGQLNVSNITNYYMHLRQHINKKDLQLRCTKCALIFVDRGSLKQHAAHHHLSLWKNAQSVRMLLTNSNLIPRPKVRTHHREPLPYAIQQKYGDFFAFIDGTICAECNSEIINEDHFIGCLKCNKCNYKTCCERAMFEHSGVCTGSEFKDDMELPLPNEMHCICGFSTAIGNKMAYHLATCGQKSAYPTVEMAQENTVKRNMLDMLGLVRRDGETAAETEDGVSDAAPTADITVTDVAPSPSPSTNDTENIVRTESSEIASTDMEVGQEPMVQDGAVDDLQQSQQVLEKSDASLIDPSTSMLFSDIDDSHVINANSLNLQQQQQQTLPDLHSQPNEDLNQHQNITSYQQIVEPHQQSYQMDFSQQPDGVHAHHHALNPADIDMPLIGELSEPNPPPTPQFLGEVHTPMFDAVAAAEQQHYHQVMQQPQQPPQ